MEVMELHHFYGTLAFWVHRTVKLGESWNSRMNASGDDPCAVTRHGSLGSLPRCCSLSSGSSAASSATLPGKARQPFSVFR